MTWPTRRRGQGWRRPGRRRRRRRGRKEARPNFLILTSVMEEVSALELLDHACEENGRRRGEIRKVIHILLRNDGYSRVSV